MNTQFIILVLLCALVGGILNALLFWLNQKPRPPFDGGSFGASLITSLVAAVGIAEVFNYAGATNLALACFGAFLSGMGGNGVIGGISGAVVNKIIVMRQSVPVPGGSGSATGTSTVSPQKGRFIWGQFCRRI